jgi:multidrug efflux pump subunit AcrA (membrane-fusion protein)
MEAVTDGTVSRKAGEVVAVSAVNERAQDAVALPLDAVRTDASGDYVYLAVSGIAKKVYIKSGIVTADYVQALSGVAAGDIVVTSWSSLLTDGAALTIVE